jgi:carboxylate-amine ligase
VDARVVDPSPTVYTRLMGVEFTPSAGPTLGVEWELGLVDATTMDLVPEAPKVFDALRDDRGDLDPRVHPEFLRNQVELVTGVCRDVGEAVADLAGALATVRAVTDPMGLEIFGAGTHPFATSADQEITESDRYALLVDRTRYWAQQMLIYGVHVHVGIDHREKVLPILNGLLPYYPHLLALSASSPYWGGVDTGYASNRSMIFHQLPTAGLPYPFERWAEYERYVSDLFTTGVITVIKEVRWDIRPSPMLGTLEVRVFDGVSSLAEIGALTALVQSLVVDLDRRIDAGEDVRRLPTWHVAENKWRGARYGLEAEVVVDAGCRERPLAEEIPDLLERLEPVSRDLGCDAELRGVADILAAGAGYRRQREVAADHGGDLRPVVRSLVADLRRHVR